MAPRWVRRCLPRGERFTGGHTDAKYAIVAVAVVGEVLQSGLVFGWNALALMLQARNNFAGKCVDPTESERSTMPPLCDQRRIRGPSQFRQEMR